MVGRYQATRQSLGLYSLELSPQSSRIRSCHDLANDDQSAWSIDGNAAWLMAGGIADEISMSPAGHAVRLDCRA